MYLIKDFTVLKTASLPSSKLSANGRHPSVHVRASPPRGPTLREGGTLLHQSHHAASQGDVLPERGYRDTMQGYTF